MDRKPLGARSLENLIHDHFKDFHSFSAGYYRGTRLSLASLTPSLTVFVLLFLDAAMRLFTFYLRRVCLALPHTYERWGRDKSRKGMTDPRRACRDIIQRAFDQVIGARPKMAISIFILNQKRKKISEIWCFNIQIATNLFANGQSLKTIAQVFFFAKKIFKKLQNITFDMIIDVMLTKNCD